LRPTSVVAPSLQSVPRNWVRPSRAARLRSVLRFAPQKLRRRDHALLECAARTRPPRVPRRRVPPQGVVRASHVRLLPSWGAVNAPHQSPNSDRHLDDRLEEGSWRTPHCKGRGWPLAQVCPRLGCRDRREAIWP
jgi:hypothetical protein